MKRISHDEYMLLRKGSELIMKDHHGDKVLSLRDGSILKLFRIKHLISSARLYPYSLRFADNAQKLKALDVPTVEVINLFNIPSIKRSAVQYKKLQGITLFHYLLDANISEEIAKKIGVFISTLHNKGIYFRSIHLENIILLPDRNFGLIDISDMSIFSHPLTLRKRNGNFKHFMRYKAHCNLLKPQLSTFVQSYIEVTGFNKYRKRKLERKILKRFDKYFLNAS